MNEGKIEQIGTPAEVYHHPATAVRVPISWQREICFMGAWKTAM